MIDYLNIWIWVKSNWGTVISMLGIGIAIRRIEIAVKHKRSSDRKAIYDRLSALESEQSSQRAETRRVDNNHNNLRDGCKVLEAKVDGAVSAADRANERSGTILSLIRKK